MKKNISGLMIAVLLPLSLIGCNLLETEMYNILESTNCHEEKKHTAAYDYNFIQSTAVFENAINHFKTSDGKFTDDFGGVYVDNNGIYNICIVGNKKPIPPDYLIYKLVDHSYNFLLSIYDETTKVMQEYSVWRAFICEECNKLLVCFEEETKISTFIEHLKEKDLFRKWTLNIYIGINDIVPL